MPYRNNPDIVKGDKTPVGADSSCPPPIYRPPANPTACPDQFIKIHDVYPDGRAELLTDGILRVRYRKSFSQPVLMLLPIIERN